MTTIDRKFRTKIAGRVGCDPRTVGAILDGKHLRHPAVEKAVLRELKREGIVLPTAAAAPTVQASTEQAATSDAAGS